MAQTNFRISSFGEDEQGEIYVADRKGGAVYQLAAGAPSTTAHAVVNAASFGGQSTAGSLASLFGVGLTTVNGASTATEFPLPPVLNGTSVTIDGISAPLLAVEFEGKTQASLVVANNGMASAAVTIPLGVQPGLFASSRDGTGNRTSFDGFGNSRDGAGAGERIGGDGGVRRTRAGVRGTLPGECTGAGEPADGPDQRRSSRRRSDQQHAAAGA